MSVVIEEEPVAVAPLEAARQAAKGDLDDAQRRGRGNGWRFHALPWVQE